MYEILKNTINKHVNHNLLIVLSICILTLISLANIALIFSPQPTIIEAKEDIFESKISFWKNFLAIHPTYFEGWIELSKLQIGKGNYQEAVLSYQKAFSINPNSEELKILKIKLGV